MSGHRCTGADCGICDRRIEAIEYDRAHPDEYPDHYDGT